MAPHQNQANALISVSIVMQTHDIEVDAAGSQRVVGKTPGIKQYVSPHLAIY